MATRTTSYEVAVSDWRRVAATSDRAWLTYRKARERRELKRFTYAAEEGVITASAAVGRAQDNLADKATILRRACRALAEQELASAARACVPYKAPSAGEVTVRAETLFAAAIGGA
jgi:hypothetical protein